MDPPGNNWDQNESNEISSNRQNSNDFAALLFQDNQNRTKQQNESYGFPTPPSMAFDDLYGGSGNNYYDFSGYPSNHDNNYSNPSEWHQNKFTQHNPNYDMGQGSQIPNIDHQSHGIPEACITKT